MTDGEFVARPRSGVGHNAAWLMAADLIGKIASFALVVVVARGFGVRQYGYFSFTLAFVPLLLQPARWGVGVTMVRNIVRDPQRPSRAIVNGFALRSSTASIAAVLAAAIGMALIHDGTARAALAILAAALLIDEMSTFVMTVFQAYERMRFAAQMLLVNRIISTSLAIVVVRAGGGFVAVCGTYALGSASALVSGIVVFRRTVPPVSRADLTRHDVRALFAEGAPYAAAEFFNMGIFRADSVLLQLLEGPVSVGMYGIAYRFFEPMLFAAWGLGEAALPRFIRDREGGETATYELCLALVVTFYLPFAIVAPFTVEAVIRLLFSARYAPAEHAAAWLLAALCFYGVAHLTRVACAALDRRSGIAWVAGAALSFNVVANLIVIPRRGFTGAAEVTFVTEVLEAAGLIALYCRTGARFPLRRLLLVPISACAVLLVVLVAADARGMSAGAIGAVAYVLALLTIGRVLIGRDLRGVIAPLVRPATESVPPNVGS